MRRKSQAQAFTLIELLVVMGVIGILAGIAALNVGGLQKPALSDSRAIAAALKAARSHALSTTSAVRVTYNNATRTLSMQRADLCSVTASTGWTNLPASYNVTLHPAVGAVTPLDPNPWQVCFTSRGLANSTPQLQLKDRNRTQIYTISVFLGGAVKVTP